MMKMMTKSMRQRQEMIRNGSRSMMTTRCKKMIKSLLIRHMIYMLEKIVMNNM